MTSLIHYQMKKEITLFFRIKAPVQTAGLNTYWEIAIYIPLLQSFFIGKNLYK